MAIFVDVAGGVASGAMDGSNHVNAGELHQRFADRLKELTNRSGFSVRDLEKLTMLSKSTVQDALRGRHFPRLDTVVKIVEACAGDEEKWRTEWAEVNSALQGARRTKPRSPHNDQRGVWRRPPPRQLPATVADFVGRSSELGMLTEQLDKSVQGAGTVVIISIEGTAGVGKTALALWWGNRVSDRFPDGQLHVDLHGYRAGPPRRSDEALALMLSALGVPATQVPAGEDERAALYRSLLAGKKMLVVLDNATSPEQVRPLLPGSPGCLVLVTSRGGLPGLVAGNGARQITLDRLSPAEAIELLRRILGRARVDAAPDAAAEIARRCAYLPLALRVAAQLALASPQLTLAEIADQLATAQHRLDLLATSDNDPSTNVRSVLSWSYRALPTAAARLFRLLGMHAGPQIGIPAAASLTDATTTEAEQLLEILAGAHLLERAGPGRYRFHDLLREYAVEQAADEPERDAAVQRVLDMYLYTADAADRALAPNRLRARIDPPPACPVPAFPTYSAALEWFDLECANLTAAAYQAAETGLDDIAWKIPAAMSIYCYIRKPWADWTTSHEIGLAAARRRREPFGEAAMLTGLGAAQYELHQYQQAVNHLQQARALWRDIENRWGEAITLNILGSAHRDLRQFEQAIACFHQALAIWPELDHTWGKGVTLHNLGTTYRQLGQTESAINWLHQSIALRRAMPDRYGEAWAIHDLGTIHAELQHSEEAITCFHQTLAIRQEIGDRHGEAQTHYELGKNLQATGNPTAAANHLRQAAAIFDDLHDPRTSDIRAHLTTLLSPDATNPR